MLASEARLNLGHVLLQYDLVAGAAVAVQPQREEEGEGAQIRFAHAAEAGFVPAPLVAAHIKLSPSSQENKETCAPRMHEEFGRRQRSHLQRSCSASASRARVSAWLQASS